MLVEGDVALHSRTCHAGRPDEFTVVRSRQGGHSLSVVSCREESCQLRRRRSLRPTFFATLLVATIVLGGIPSLIAAPAVAGEQKAQKQQDVIVVLKRGANPRAVARGAGARPTHVYEHVIDGFAAKLPPQAIQGLEHNPAVIAVVPDRPVEAFAIASPGDGVAVEASPAPRKCKKIDNKQRRQQCIKKAKKHERRPRGTSADLPSGSGSVAPPGRAARASDPHRHRPDRRGRNPSAGIDRPRRRRRCRRGGARHRDRRAPRSQVAGGVSCLGPSSADDNGHGTHAAGTIGALDNAIGVVGVAPGARLWAVKVLDARGDGSFSSVICGLDWVYANRGTIDVVNLSLGR